jgi:N-acetylglucosamine kinase-like BadF-type ATPase
LLSPGDVPGECAFAPETLVVENDAVVALARATNGAARGGALLVAGTGTIAFAVSHAGKQTRTMGFGPAFGDPGSGHHLGTKALAATARALDGRRSVRRETSDVADSDDALVARREGESIARAVLTKLGFDVTTRTEEEDEVDVFDAACQKMRDARREDLTRWAYGEGPAPAWDRVASLAPIIFDEYKRGNVTAVGIINESAGALADNVVVAIERAHEDESVSCSKTPFVVALAGGLFEDGSPDGYRALVEGKIDRILKARKLEMDVEFYDDPASGKHGDIGGPLKGAVKMAIRSFEAWRRRVPDADLFYI